MIADSITGTATAGSILELEVLEIAGYIPVNKTPTEVIGYNNNFVVKYTECPKKSIENATVTVENQFFAYANLTPNVKVELDGITLTQGKDFTVSYEDNYHVGTAMVIIIGTGNYDGILTANFKIIEKSHDWSQWYVDYESTEDSSGLKHRKCACCEEIEFFEIPQLKCSTPKLKSVTNDSGGVKIAWNKVTGADSYTVMRKTGNGKWTVIKNDLISTTSYTDTTAKNGTTYNYTVKAKNEAGFSAYNTIGLSIRKLAVPTKITVVNAKTGVTVKWGKVTGAAGYYVMRKTGNGSWMKIATVKGTTYTDKTAKSGYNYKYTVKAYYGKSVSAFDTKGAAIKYLADPVLKTPTSAKKGITLKWNKVTGAQGYVIYRKAGSGNFKKLTTVKGASKVSYTDKSAKKGTKYTYKLKAYSGKIYSTYSNGKTIKDKY